MKCCDMNAGMLRTPVTFQRRTRVADGAGGATETWATISGAAARAYYKALSGYERFLSNRVEARTSARIVVRYFSGLREGDRVLIDSEAHNITFINNLERRNRWLEIDIEGGEAS